MTELEVCNMALATVGHDQMMGSMDDAGRAGRLCNLWLARARRNVLSAVWCGELAQAWDARGVAEGERGYRFALPCSHSEVLQMRVQDARGRPVQVREVRGRSAFLEVDEATLLVMRDVECEDLPHLLARAVVAELAALIAYSLTGKHDVAERLRELAQVAASDARARYGNMTRRIGRENPYAEARAWGGCGA